MAMALSIDLRGGWFRRLKAGCPAGRRPSGSESAHRAPSVGAQKWREGNITPLRQGGDRHSHRIEAHAELILSAVAAQPDITLAELQEKLGGHGVAVAIGTLWRFFKRRNITRKKRRRMRPSSVAAR
jgi:hypothetical protein